MAPAPVAGVVPVVRPAVPARARQARNVTVTSSPVTAAAPTSGRRRLD
ncbi:MAG: hypothetical protein GXX79_02025 [Actinomycetales bacterium]|nr:hypothetical protein [Actinomycetales bacterium]